jgi:hypothetical protein
VRSIVTGVEIAPLKAMGKDVARRKFLAVQAANELEWFPRLASSDGSERRHWRIYPAIYRDL